MRISLVLSSVFFLTCTLLSKEIILFNNGDETVFFDTYIKEEVKGSYHEKSSLELELGTCELCRDQRIVFQCDLSSLPVDGLVTKIELQLYCTEDLLPSAANGLLYVSRKDLDISQVDWYQASEGEKWANPGGDLGLKSISKVIFDEDMEGRFVSFSLDSVIDELVAQDGSLMSFLITFDDVDHHVYASSEAENHDIRPRLIITLEEDAILKSTSAEKQSDLIQNGNSVMFRWGSLSEGVVSLFNLQGQRLESHFLRKGGISSVDFSNRTAGVYAVKFQSAHFKTQKLITLKGN